MGPPRSDETSKENSMAGPYVPEAFRSPGSPPKRPPQETGWRALFASQSPKGPPGMSGESVGGSTAGMAIHKS
jgi:hypothetical protein